VIINFARKTSLCGVSDHICRVVYGAHGLGLPDSIPGHDFMSALTVLRLFHMHVGTYLMFEVFQQTPKRFVLSTSVTTDQRA